MRLRPAKRPRSGGRHRALLASLLAALLIPANLAVAGASATEPAPAGPGAANPLAALSNSAFVGIIPAHVLDSRPGSKTVDSKRARIGLRRAGSTTELQLTGRGGVPRTDARSVLLSITVTGTVNMTAAQVAAAFAGLANNATSGTVVIHPNPTAEFSTTTSCLGAPTQFTDASAGTLILITLLICTLVA